jgi:hypothetical protein
MAGPERPSPLSRPRQQLVRGSSNETCRSIAIPRHRARARGPPRRAARAAARARRARVRILRPYSLVVCVQLAMLARASRRARRGARGARGGTAIPVLANVIRRYFRSFAALAVLQYYTTSTSSSMWNASPAQPLCHLFLKKKFFPSFGPRWNQTGSRKCVPLFSSFRDACHHPCCRFAVTPRAQHSSQTLRGPIQQRSRRPCPSRNLPTLPQLTTAT